MSGLGFGVVCGLVAPAPFFLRDSQLPTYFATVEGVEIVVKLICLLAVNASLLQRTLLG